MEELLIGKCFGAALSLSLSLSFRCDPSSIEGGAGEFSDPPLKLAMGGFASYDASFLS
jgi:hypothetical protein